MEERKEISLSLHLGRTSLHINLLCRVRNSRELEIVFVSYHLVGLHIVEMESFSAILF
jgi:hypothetical protein